MYKLFILSGSTRRPYIDMYGTLLNVYEQKTMTLTCVIRMLFYKFNLDNSIDKISKELFITFSVKCVVIVSGKVIDLIQYFF